MRTPKASPWIAGTAALVVLLLAAAWFLLVSPVLTTASETSATAEQVEGDNAVLRDRIVVLQEQFANIETYRAELATLRTAVPDAAEISDYLRQLNDLGAAHSVAVLTVTPQPPTSFTPAAPAGAPVATEPVATDGTEPAAPVDAGAAAPAPVASAPQGMVSIPVNLGVVGTYDNIRGFLSALQTGTPRLLLVESVAGMALADAQAGGGRPATAVGDVELTISAHLFVLPAQVQPVAPADAPVEQPALPVPPEGRNPLVPLG